MPGNPSVARDASSSMPDSAWSPPGREIAVARLDTSVPVLVLGGKENLQPMQQKPNVRSLQPPPSLAGKFTAPPPAATPALSEDQRASLRQVASQLREILNLLEQGDEELERLRGQSE